MSRASRPESFLLTMVGNCYRLLELLPVADVSLTEILNLLHIGPFQANNVDSRGLEGCIREKYKALFTGVGLLKGYGLKLHIDERVKGVSF